MKGSVPCVCVCACVCMCVYVHVQEVRLGRELQQVEQQLHELQSQHATLQVKYNTLSHESQAKYKQWVAEVGARERWEREAKAAQRDVKTLQATLQHLEQVGVSCRDRVGPQWPAMCHVRAAPQGCFLQGA